MSQQPPAAGFRGAVDLSALASSPAQPASSPTGSPTGARAAGGAAGRPGIRSVTDATFGQALQGLMDVPVLLVLWSARDERSRQHVDDLVGLARSREGRVAVLDADVDANPGIFQAFQPRAVPHVVALLAGQPAPLWEGPQPVDAVAPVIDKLLEVALTEGLTGRVDVAAADEASAQEAPEEPPLPEHLEKAYAALEAGDVDAARATLRQALEANPRDEESRLVLAQVELMARTRGADAAQARAAAAADPSDIEAALTVADLDVLGGHVEDAFRRLVELVKRTSGDERSSVREHLVQLFDVVGADDPRVVEGRRALMSALF